MKVFELGKRVYLRRVVPRPHADTIETPSGCAGTVVRLLRRDSSAWIALDRRYPSLEAVGAFPFSADDEHGRGTHVLAWPEDCERAALAAARKETP